jgi:hypothetical protein
MLDGGGDGRVVVRVRGDVDLTACGLDNSYSERQRPTKSVVAAFGIRTPIPRLPE